MNSVVEKLAAIEKEVAVIQPKMMPLTERIADLDQKVAGLAEQLTGIAEESAAVKQDIELTRNGLARIQTLIGESKAESEQLVAGQEENLQRCETMTAVFGEAFQAVSKFFETAQRMGLTDQAKAVFLNAPSLPEVPTAQSSVSDAVSSAMAAPYPPRSRPHTISPAALPSELKKVWNRLPSIPELALSEHTNEIPLPSEPPPIVEALTPEPELMDESKIESILSDSDFDSVMSNASESDTNSSPVPDLPGVTTLPEMADADLGAIDSSSEADAEQSGAMTSDLDVPPPIVEALTPEPELMDESKIESILSDSDFDSVMSSASESDMNSSPVPGLPDVATLPEMADADLGAIDSSSEADAEQSGTMASDLDVPPLNLAAPALSEPNAPMTETDDQAIEDLLASMAIPVTAGAGN